MQEKTQFPEQCIHAKPHMITYGIYLCNDKNNQCDYKISTMSSIYCAIELDRHKQKQKELSDKIQPEEIKL